MEMRVARTISKLVSTSRERITKCKLIMAVFRYHLTYFQHFSFHCRIGFAECLSWGEKWLFSVQSYQSSNTSAICLESFRISSSIILAQSLARHSPWEMERRAFLSRRIELKGIRIFSHNVTLYIIYGFKHRYIVTMELRKETLIMKMSALSFWLLRFRIYY